jgi:hypothetical protein
MADDAPDLPEEEEATARDQREEEAGVRVGVRGRPFAPGNPYRLRPGQSGNPAGRPKGWRALFREHAEEIESQDPQKRQRVRLLIERLWVRAVKDGNIQAAREYLDRADGRVPLALRMGPDEDEGPREIRIRVVGRDDIDLEALRLRALSSGNGNGNGDGTA